MLYTKCVACSRKRGDTTQIGIKLYLLNVVEIAQEFHLTIANNEQPFGGNFAPVIEKQAVKEFFFILESKLSFITSISVRCMFQSMGHIHLCQNFMFQVRNEKGHASQNNIAISLVKNSGVLKVDTSEFTFESPTAHIPLAYPIKKEEIVEIIKS